MFTSPEEARVPPGIGKELDKMVNSIGWETARPGAKESGILPGGCYGPGIGPQERRPLPDPAKLAEQYYSVLQQGYPSKTTYDPRMLRDGRPEFYPQLEPQVPYARRYPYEKPIFAQRRTDSPEFSLGEYAHLLALVDPTYKKLIEGMKPGHDPEWDHWMDFYKKALIRLTKGRGYPYEVTEENFEDVWNQSGREGILRGYALPNTFNGEEFVPLVGTMPRYQRQLMERLKEYLLQQPGQTDLERLGRTM